MSITTPKPISPAQRGLIERLRRERGLAPLSDEDFAGLTGGRTGTASATIDGLFDTPKAASTEPERREAPDELQPGVYEVDGVAYIVKPNRAKDRLYAKRVVEIGGTRSTEAGTFVAVEFEYDPGAIFRIHPEHRMTGDRAKALTLRYGKCICCGRDLKAGESVEQGIGPVCVKNFPELEAERKEIAKRARAEAKAARLAPVAAEEEVPSDPVEDAIIAEEVRDAAWTPGDEDEVDIVALARAIEGLPPVEETPVDPEGDDAAPGTVEQPTRRETHPIDEDVARVRPLLANALTTARFEGVLSDDEERDVLSVFERLVRGFER